MKKIAKFITTNLNKTFEITYKKQDPASNWSYQIFNTGKNENFNSISFDLSSPGWGGYSNYGLGIYPDGLETHPYAYFMISGKIRHKFKLPFTKSEINPALKNIMNYVQELYSNTTFNEFDKLKQFARKALNQFVTAYQKSI